MKKKYYFIHDKYIVQSCFFLYDDYYINDFLTNNNKNNIYDDVSINTVDISKYIMLTCFVTDNNSSLMLISKSIKCFLCCKEINDEIPYDYTIFLGENSFSVDILIIDTLHFYNIPFKIVTADFSPTKITMREYSVSDFDKVYCEFHGNKYIDDYMSNTYLEEKNNFFNYIKSYLFFYTGYWGIWDDNRLIGQIGIQHHSLDNLLENYHYIIDPFIMNEKSNPPAMLGRIV